MTRFSVVSLCIALLVSGAALAQKSKDTVRIPVGEPISGLSDYLNPNPENEFYSAAVHDTLITFDEDQNKYAPLLVKGWRRVDDRATEFELRDDVKWHDGEAFDADDVVHTLEWLIHPEVKLRNKRNYEWIEKVEKLGAHKVRITARKPTPFDEAQLSNNIYMLPEHLHAKLPLTDKLAFARKPVGTGMFRAAEVSDARGIFLVKNDAYRHGGMAKPAGNIKYMNLPFMPDYGGRIAEFLAGNVDMLARQLTIDQMEDLAKQPNVKASLVQGASIAYMAIDARGRAGVPALTDARVRRAMFMAIDRPALAKLVAGDQTLNRMPEALCWKDQMGCDYTLLPPAHDPAGAKKLLAEAGYPNGFDLEISTYTTTVADFAVGISGQLSKIGIRATVQKHTIAAHRKVESEGRIAVMVGGYPTGSTPDTSNVLAFFFDPPPSSDYHADAELHGLVKQMDGVMDPAKRKELARKVFDRATEQAYFMVVGPRPVQMVYRDYLDVKPSRYANVGFQPGGVNWK
jgi:peptide/nickel transport system substrate-binding protein